VAVSAESDRRPPAGSGRYALVFSFDGDPHARTAKCERCGTDHDSVTGFVLRDGNAHAIYFAEWHPDAGEAYIDVILGSFAEPDYLDNVTLGCRVGHVAIQAEPACSLVRGGAIRSDKPIFGRKLDRDEALTHPRLDAFWSVVDWLIINDPVLHENVFHMPPRHT
jgi:hypothetical protein